MSIAASTTATVVSSVAKRETTGGSDGNGGELVSGVGGDITSLAFEALLSTSRTFMGAAQATPGDAMSFAQMFEPASPDAHARRRSALEEDYRANVGHRTGADRFDRTSVGARESWNANRSNDARSRPVAAGAGFPEADLGAKIPSGGLGVEAIATGLGANREEGSLTHPGVGSSRAAGLSSSGLTNSSHAVEFSQRELRPAAPGAMVMASKTAKGQNQAQRVGQLLAAARAGQAETTRPASSAALSTEAHASATDKTAASRSLARNPREANASGPKPEARHTAGAPDRSVFDAFVRSIRLNAGARRSTARLRLHPPELGRMSIEVRMVDDQVRIEVRTETKAARQLVQERASELTAALERQGIYVERFEVSADHPGGNSDDPLGGGGADVTAEQEPRTRAGAVPLWSDDVPGEIIEDETGMVGEPSVTTVSKTRLDIRV